MSTSGQRALGLVLATSAAKSFQCGLIPGTHAANAIYVLKMAAELSHDWGNSLYMVELDLTKAFDSVLHSTVLCSLSSQNTSLQCIASICGMLLQIKVAATLVHITFHVQREVGRAAMSEAFRKGRGLGAAGLPIVKAMWPRFELCLFHLCCLAFHNGFSLCPCLFHVLVFVCVCVRSFQADVRDFASFWLEEQ